MVSIWDVLRDMCCVYGVLVTVLCDCGVRCVMCCMCCVVFDVMYATGTHLGDVTKDWKVRADNMKTYADGLLRLESHGPASCVNSLATGSVFSISDPPPVEHEEHGPAAVTGVVCFPVFDMLWCTLCVMVLRKALWCAGDNRGENSKESAGRG